MGRNPGFADMARKRKVTIWEMRKNWKIVYDQGWRELMGEVAEELRLDIGDVERINSAWWKYVAEMMARPELPVIRMDYLCKLYPSVKKLRAYCEWMGDRIEMWSKGISGNRRIGDVGNMRKHLGVLQDSYMRIVEENAEVKARGPLNRRSKDKLHEILIKMIDVRKLKEINNDRQE